MHFNAHLKSRDKDDKDTLYPWELPSSENGPHTALIQDRMEYMLTKGRAIDLVGNEGRCNENSSI